MPITRSVGKERNPSTESKPSSSYETTRSRTAATTDASVTESATVGTSVSATTDTSTVRSVIAGTTVTALDNTVHTAVESPNQTTEQYHAKPSQPPRSQYVGSSRTKKKSLRLAVKETTHQQSKLDARARIDADETDEDDDLSIYSTTLSNQRVDHWLNNQPQTQPIVLTIANKPRESSAEIITQAITAGDVSDQQRETHYSQVPPTSQALQITTEAPIQSDFTQLTAAIMQAIQAAQRPNRFIELPVFSGQHHEWLSFQAAYKETEGTFSAVENINRLRRNLVGRAKEAVESLLITNARPSDVMNTLEMRFGRPEIIAMKELDSLRTLPRLNESLGDIFIFSTKITNVVCTMRALNYFHYLHHPEIAKNIIEKLTPTLRHRYYDFAALGPREEPELVKIEAFMKKEAELCSRYARPEQTTPHSYNAQQRRPHKINIVTERQPTPIFRCPVCEEIGHVTKNCAKFINADINERWDITKKKRLCFRCLCIRKRTHNCRPRPCGVDGCKYTHNRALHFNIIENAAQTEPTENINSAWTTSDRTYLKIIPVRASGPKGTIDTYALLDDGSTVTLIDDGIAHAIGAKGTICPLRIEAINAMKTSEAKSRRVNLTLNGLNDKKQRIQARTVQNLHISPQEITENYLLGCKHLADIRNVLSYGNAKPTILIGQDNWHLLLATKVRKGNKKQPVASLTPLGWVLHGGYTRTIGHSVSFVSHMTETTHDNMEKLMKEYFTMDSLCIAPKRPQSDPEERALRILQENTKRTEQGKYETALLWKKEDINLPDNYENSLKRLFGIERKLDRNPSLKQKYTEQMEALVTKGYAEPAPETKTAKRTWYLPHFAVVNSMKPDKLRVVHDAAAKTRGVALNDMLLKGPDLLQSLPGVVMRFRQHTVAVTADIAEMFMQVKLRIEDRDALRYLWRSNKRDNEPPQEYRMTSLIFGASSSPSTAIYVKNLNARRYEETHAEATNAIIKKHYVDDYLDSFATLEDAIRITANVRNIHKEASFELKQWKSNTPQLLEALGEKTSNSGIELYKSEEQVERVLGLIWKPETDNLTFNLNLTRIPHTLIDGKTPTKREALKVVMSLFDPLGFASPVTAKAKQILQEVWRRGTAWDEHLDEDVANEWQQWMKCLKKLSDVSIPRRYLGYSDATSLQLHVFTDASESAYATVLYWRATTPDGEIKISLIMAKAKVAPLKITSIPRLELQAAVMGTRLAESVIEEHDRKPDSKTFWTDSRTVLTWIKTGSRSYKPYVAHRIAAIEESTTINEWRWVPTKSNVADDATRDVPIGFGKDHRWYKGPDFLYSHPNTWPTEVTTTPTAETTGEERVNYIVDNITPKLAHGLPKVTRFSSWERLRYTTARVLQFIQLCRTSRQNVYYKRNKANKQADPVWKKAPKTASTTRVTREKTAKTEKLYVSVSAELLRQAEELLMKSSQEDAFAHEIECLNKQKPLSNDSRLRHLSIEYIDGTLQLRSRISATEAISDNIKRPTILDGDHYTVRLWIRNIHRQMHHAGVEATINECRQHYWVLRIRPTTRMLIRQCLQCRMKTQEPPHPRTGDLPPCRLAHHKRPFTFTGVDYFGPLTVTVGRTQQKRYAVIFTCLTTRAIHLEMAPTLSTDSAIMALRRMIARRGRPKQIWSDNGTNLKGADKELRQTIDASTAQEAAHRAIAWRFIPPGAPFMGGAWERLVRSVKTALQTTLRERRPSEEVLITLLTEAEYTVNSRPLTHVSVSADDPDALTPNHFILGGPGNVTSPGDFNDNDLNLKSSWRTAQRLSDIFWARWLREYLPELQNRREPHGRGVAVKVGDLVQLVDSNLPRNVWVRGRVIATYPGPDNIVRAVDIVTKRGVLRKPVRKLVILPIDDVVPAPTEDATRSHGGRMCRTTPT